MTTDWHARWMARAEQLASWSKDPSTKVGCVLVLNQHSIAEGYNGFPHGANDDPSLYLDRPMKYERTVHAEANAVAHAARYGHATFGALAFSTFPVCPPCAGLLLQAGISGLVVKTPRCRHCDRAGRHNSYGPRYRKSVSGVVTGPYIHDCYIGSGREEITCELPEQDSWTERFTISQQLLKEAGIPVTLL